MVAVSLKLVLAAALSALPLTSAQTFQRLGTCPTFGCLLPPDAQDFLPGQRFDIRAEIHAPVNGSEATNSTGVANRNFTVTIQPPGGRPQPLAQYFKINQTAVLPAYNFTWFETLAAQDAKQPSVVNVASQVWRNIYLTTPGDYKVVLTYNGGQKTEAVWTVRNVPKRRKAKNVILFIGDGMTINMVTAARLIGHKSVNGRYLTKMAIDKFPGFGLSMTHSIDSYITDSANSATALYSGHKTTVNALGVYADSSADPFDDPKFESIVEIFSRIAGGTTGIVSTAFLADATPAGFTAHTRSRGTYPQIIDSFLNGITANYSWTPFKGFDFIAGGGAENFCTQKKGSFQGQDYYKLFANASYTVAYNKDQLLNAPKDKRFLGVFSVSNMAKWLDRNVYKNNLMGHKDSPTCDGTDAVDQPGLKEMTLKAIDVLDTRAKAKGDKGFFLMSEAASIDKMMHVLDYDRALADLLELDDTVKATVKKLKEMGELENTQIIVTADHGHGFDVFGSVDTDYLNKAKGDRQKRRAVGTYQNSGLSQYINTGSLKFGDSNFPSNWNPRYTLAQGVAANPDHRENYQVHTDGPREPATNITGFASNDYYVNYVDAVTGFVVNGTLPTNADQGVHSLTDVGIWSRGPCYELFNGHLNNIDIFFGMAQCLGLSQPGDKYGNDDDDCDDDDDE